MKKELLAFSEEFELSPFNRTKTQIRSNSGSVFKTKDAKSVHTKALGTISDFFVFPDTSNLLQFFQYTSSTEEIIRRQNYFRSISTLKENASLKSVKLPRPSWKPQYSVAVVTEDETTFLELKKIGCPVRFVLSENDVRQLEESDVVQVIDCEQFGLALESLPQSVFLNSLDEAYLERFLEQLSGWKENLSILRQISFNSETDLIVQNLSNLLTLTGDESSGKITRQQVEEALDKVNSAISEQVRNMTVSGDFLISALSTGSLPRELLEITQNAIRATNLPDSLFIKKIPVAIDEEELEKKLRDQDLNRFSSSSERIKQRSSDLLKIPEQLKKLERALLIFDFEAGISRWISSFSASEHPESHPSLTLSNARNIFLSSPQPVSFYLTEREPCSILTGANSGGKTTLIEHILQTIVLHQIGLPCPGSIKVPLFSEIYYFAKNKGSMSKGAFETLLTQMSQIKPGRQTLILADEIESVTEPGVAGKMIAATADYFIKKGCFMVIATHLGHEIQKFLPAGARIDGIEAKGLDENNELIVDHNPVLGRLAH